MVLPYPVMWVRSIFGRAGNSTTARRSTLLSRFCAVFGETAIAGLIADREFIGTAWMSSLAERDIPFILQHQGHLPRPPSDERHCQVRSLFRKLGVGGLRYIREDCRLGSRDSLLGPLLKLAATRLVSGELLVVATNTDPKVALAHYRRRWEIETLFAATKTRGFNFEDTHIVHPTASASFSLCWLWPLRSPTPPVNGRRNTGPSSSRPTNAVLNRSSGSALIC